MYHFTAFNTDGVVLHPMNHDYKSCIDSENILLRQLVSLSKNDTIAVVAIRVGDDYRDNMAKIEDLGLIADEFLAPRLEWRIMAERFEDFEESDTMDVYDTSAVRPGKVLLDPTAYADMDSKDYTSTFADPFVAAHAMLETTGVTVDLILLRVFEEKLNAMSEAIQERQFPGVESDDIDGACAANLEKTHGRMIVKYGGKRDFLGALTDTNTNQFIRYMDLGFPYAEVSPVHWAETYQFHSCNAETVASIDPEYGIINGMECGFLPIWGGPCLDIHKPALKCLSEFEMGSLIHAVLPKDGVPAETCALAKEQIPVGEYSPRNNGPPEAFIEWCPHCHPYLKDRDQLDFSLSTEDVKDSTKPIGFQHLDDNIDTIHAARNSEGECMKVPLQCGDSLNPRLCCYHELEIEQNVLGAKNATATKLRRRFIKTFLSNYLSRFNRYNRRRVARARLPREEGMFARGEGWKEVLATGKCVSIHIRRGDNIQRCEKNPGSKFCTMDLTLADYMDKAEPMMKELGDAKHIFLMTDDSEVANVTMQAPYLEKGYHFEVISGFNQYSLATYTSWDTFLESLYGVQFCRAFVGHWISSVAMLVYHRLCLRNGECPMANDHGEGNSPNVAW